MTSNDDSFLNIFLTFIGGIVTILLLVAGVSLLYGLLVWWIWNGLVAGPYYDNSNQVVWVLPNLTFYQSLGFAMISGLLLSGLSFSSSSKKS